MSKQQDFIDRIAPIAVKIAAERKANGESYIPPSYFVAKLALESDWGTSDKAEHHNYGGLKSGSGRDTPFTDGSKSFPTWEEVNGRKVNITDKFQTFDTAEDGLRGIEHYLRTRGLYDEAFNHSDDPVAFARAVEAGGYATDSNRLGKIMDIMNNPEYNLRALDEQVAQAASTRTAESPSVSSGEQDARTSVASSGVTLPSKSSIDGVALDLEAHNPELAAQIRDIAEAYRDQDTQQTGQIAEAMDGLRSEITQVFEQAGIEPDMRDYTLAVHLGPYSAAALLQADGSTPVTEIDGIHPESLEIYAGELRETGVELPQDLGQVSTDAFIRASNGFFGQQVEQSTQRTRDAQDDSGEQDEQQRQEATFFNSLLEGMTQEGGGFMSMLLMMVVSMAFGEGGEQPAPERSQQSSRDQEGNQPNTRETSGRSEQSEGKQRANDDVKFPGLSEQSNEELQQARQNLSLFFGEGEQSPSLSLGEDGRLPVEEGFTLTDGVPTPSPSTPTPPSSPGRE